MDHLDNPFIECLSAAGVVPGDVAIILHTHIHSYHVGWNTRRHNERWVTTIPYAIICSDLEWRYGAALADKDEAAIARCRQEWPSGPETRIGYLCRQHAPA